MDNIGRPSFTLQQTAGVAKHGRKSPNKSGRVKVISQVFKKMLFNVQQIGEQKSLGERKTVHKPDCTPKLTAPAKAMVTTRTGELIDNVVNEILEHGEPIDNVVNEIVEHKEALIKSSPRPDKTARSLLVAYDPSNQTPDDEEFLELRDLLSRGLKDAGHPEIADHPKQFNSLMEKLQERNFERLSEVCQAAIKKFRKNPPPPPPRTSSLPEHLRNSTSKTRPLSSPATTHRSSEEQLQSVITRRKTPPTPPPRTTSLPEFKSTSATESRPSSSSPSENSSIRGQFDFKNVEKVFVQSSNSEGLPKPAEIEESPEELISTVRSAKTTEELNTAANRLNQKLWNLVKQNEGAPLDAGLQEQLYQAQLEVMVARDFLQLEEASGYRDFVEKGKSLKANLGLMASDIATKVKLHKQPAPGNISVNCKIAIGFSASKDQMDSMFERGTGVKLVSVRDKEHDLQELEKKVEKKKEGGVSDELLKAVDKLKNEIDDIKRSEMKTYDDMFEDYHTILIDRMRHAFAEKYDQCLEMRTGKQRKKLLKPERVNESYIEHLKENKVLKRVNNDWLSVPSKCDEREMDIRVVMADAMIGMKGVGPKGIHTTSLLKKMDDDKKDQFFEIWAHRFPDSFSRFMGTGDPEELTTDDQKPLI